MDGLRLVTMVYVTRRNVDGLRWLMMDEYVRLCTICEDKSCSNLPRESNRIIFQSKYYLAGSVWMQFCSKTYYFSHGIIVLVISYTNFSAINLSISLSRNHRKCSEIHDALFQSNLDEIKFHRTIKYISIVAFMRWLYFDVSLQISP